MAERSVAPRARSKPVTNRERAVAAQLEQCEVEFRAGRKKACLKAISICFQFGNPVPAWAQRAFVTGVTRYETAEARTLDEALGVKRPKGWRQSRARARLGKGTAAYVMVNALTHPSENSGRQKMSVEEAVADVAERLRMKEAAVWRWHSDKELKAELSEGKGKKKG
ncbi:hypothetical protein [Dyella solisilvae]|nr:hypothetical protein [Dyella solisilvae]